MLIVIWGSIGSYPYALFHPVIEIWNEVAYAGRLEIVSETFGRLKSTEIAKQVQSAEVVVITNPTCVEVQGEPSVI